MHLIDTPSEEILETFADSFKEPTYEIENSLEVYLGKSTKTEIGKIVNPLINHILMDYSSPELQSLLIHSLVNSAISASINISYTHFLKEVKNKK